MSDVKTNKPLGMKWFVFYTKVRPILACLAVFTTIVDFAQYTDVYLSYWWLLLYFAAAIVQPVLCIIVAVKAEKEYTEFLRFVKGVLLFETFTMAYQQGVKKYINDFEIGAALIIFAVIFLLMFFVWYRLNVKYFEKRKPASTVEAIEDKPMNESEKIRFCRKCGEELMDGSNFCRKCGTEVVKESQS